MNIEKNFKPEEVSKLSKERTLNDAELIKNGAEYVNEKNGPRLEVTKEQLNETKEEMEASLDNVTDPASPKFPIGWQSLNITKQDTEPFPVDNYEQISPELLHYFQTNTGSDDYYDSPKGFNNNLPKIGAKYLNTKHGRVNGVLVQVNGIIALFKTPQGLLVVPFNDILAPNGKSYGDNEEIYNTEQEFRKRATMDQNRAMQRPLN